MLKFDANILVIILVSLCFSSCIPSVKSNSGDSSCEELVAEGEYYYTSKEYEKALDLYTSIVKQCPSDIEAKYRLAVLFGKNDMDDESLFLFLEIVEDDPSNAKAYYNIGVLYLKDKETGNDGKAKFAFEKYMDVADDTSLKNDIGKWLSQNTKLQSIDIDENSSTKKEYKKKDYNSIKKEGINYLKSDKYLLAEKSFLVCLTMNHNDADIHYQLGVVYGYLNKIEESKEQFLKTLEKDFSYSKAYYNLGVIYSTYSKYYNIEKARFFFTKFLDLEPKSPNKDKINQWLETH